MDIIASGSPYRNYRYRVTQPRVLRRRGGLMGLGGALVDAAQAKVDQAKNMVGQTASDLDFAKNKFDPKYGSTEPLDWAQLPPFITSVPDILDMRGWMLDLAKRGLDRVDLQTLVMDANADQRQRLAAWFALRVWPIYGGVTSVLGTIAGSSGEFNNGTVSIKYATNSPESFAQWATNPQEWDRPKKGKYAFLEGRLFTMGMGWAQRGGIPQRQAVIQKLSTDLAVAQAILSAAQTELAAAQQQEAGKTGGGLTQADVDQIEEDKKDAEGKAKLYMILGAVAVVAVGGYFYMKFRR